MRKIILAVFISFFFTTVFAQQHNFWTPVNESSVGRDLFVKSNTERPSSYKIFQLDETSFKTSLATAPSEKMVSSSRSSFVISFPVPDGSIEQFRVVDAPVMAPELAARYPGINSYAGAGIEDPGSTIRFDVSPGGVHAMILSANRSTIYIDQLDANYYRVVSRKDVTDHHSQFRCLTDAVSKTSAGTARTEDADDAKLRVYRLALCSSGEFSQHFLDGTEPNDAARKAKVLIAQNSHMTRANAVFERDFGVRLVLVANNDLVIYLDPATDPFTSTGLLNGQTQAAIDLQIGTANYDIGHLEHKGQNNGNAGCIGCVCVNGLKGSGWSIYSNPSLLDFFVIDYLSHEMGHQLGANHTFSYNTEGTGVNIEPGSGSTIMSYAGITGGFDIQPHSDDFFHSLSIQQVTIYIKGTTGGACAQITNTGDISPAANAGPDYTIPFSTPFILTGAGSDGNAADVLTYNWEQTDNRSGNFPSIPVSTATDGPMFRAYLPTTSASRTVPALPSILSGANGSQWEVLPSAGRALNFRFIVRDNHSGGGNNKSDDMVVTVSGSAGPFSVSSPNTAVNWNAGSTQTVTWTVNGSDSAPVSCANVNILMSTDGGLTFPIVLAANTPNDGSQDIILPCTVTTTARIKVEAVGNIFFDISNTNFIIQQGFDFTSPSPAISTCPVPASLSVTLGSTTSCGFTSPVTLSASGNPAGTTVTFSTNPVSPGSSTLVTLTGTNTLSGGSYVITISGTATGAATKTKDLTYVINTGATPVVTTQPASQFACAVTNATFTVAATNASAFQWQVSTLATPVFTDIAGATSVNYIASGVSAAMNGNQYRAVVNAVCAPSVTSNAALLTVINPVTISAQPVNAEICSGSNTSFTVAGSSSQAIIYQWQVNTGTGFVNVSNAVSYSGATTAALTITGATTAMSGNLYRCLLTNATCTTPSTSVSATLTVRQLPKIGLVADPTTSLLPGQSTTLTATPTLQTTGILTTSWFKNGTAFANTGNIYVVDVEKIGGYQVKIQEVFTSGFVCAAVSPIVAIDAVVSNKLFIFPSPNNGQFTVSYYNAGGNSVSRTVTVYDSDGHKIYNKNFAITGLYTLLNIDVRRAQKGILYLLVGDANGKKLVKGKVLVF